MGLQVGETGLFSRSSSPFVPNVGTAEELAKAAFALAAPGAVSDKVYAIDDHFIVAALKHRETADQSRLDEAQRKVLREALLERKQNDAVQKRLEELKAAATIDIAPQVQDLLAKETAEETKS